MLAIGSAQFVIWVFKLINYTLGKELIFFLFLEIKLESSFIFGFFSLFIPEFWFWNETIYPSGLFIFFVNFMFDMSIGAQFFDYSNFVLTKFKKKVSETLRETIFLI